MMVSGVAVVSDVALLHLPKRNDGYASRWGTRPASSSALSKRHDVRISPHVCEFGAFARASPDDRETDFERRAVADLGYFLMAPGRRS